MRGLAAVILICGVTSAWAAPAPADKRREANAALQAGDTDAALARVEEGLAAAPKNLDLLLLRGHVLLKMSDYEGALAAYKTYLAAGATGGNRRAVERIVANLNNVTSTFLHVVVANGPAQIFVDARSGKPFCVADPECKKGVVPGDHVVFVDRAGFATATARISVEPNTTVTVAKTLVERPSALAITVDPGDAVVSVDGAPLGTRKELAAGRHVIAVTRQGYVPRAQDVVAAAGAPVTMTVRLSRGVPFAVDPADATVEIDGTPAAVAAGLLALPPGAGAHVVRARAPGRRPAEAAIPAVVPADFRVSLTLAVAGARLRVNGAPDGATLFVDGTARGTLPLGDGGGIELEPGRHSVEVVARGFLPFRGSTEVPAGQAAVVRIDELKTPSHTKTWVCGGIAVAGVGVGTVFGLLALGEMGSFDDEKPRAGVTQSDATLVGHSDSGKSYARIADVAFGVGLIGFAAGFYFWRSEGGGESAGGIEVGPGSVAYSGRF